MQQQQQRMPQQQVGLPMQGQRQGQLRMDEKEWTMQMRLGFIRKVYGIITYMLIITFLLCFASMTTNPYSTFQKTFTFFVFVAIVCSCASFCSLICNRELARSVPKNYMCLTFFTFCESYMIGYICQSYDAKTVISAAFMTACVTIGITVYAWTTKTDFTMMGGTLFVLGFALIGVGLSAIIIGSEALYLLYCFLGVVIYGLYLIYDTQLLIGKGKVKFSTDDYIVAALQIYLDIIIIFLKILEIFGRN